jgi:hypothetical protein
VENSRLIAVALTILFVAGLVLFRLLWAALQVASASALGRLPKLPKILRCWLFDERSTTPHTP